MEAQEQRDEEDSGDEQEQEQELELLLIRSFSTARPVCGRELTGGGSAAGVGVGAPLAPHTGAHSAVQMVAGSGVQLAFPHRYAPGTQLSHSCVVVEPSSIRTRVAASPVCASYTL